MRDGERAELRRLMARLADGDRSAFRPAFALLWPSLRAFAVRWLGPADGEDAAQTALLRVFSRASEYDRERDALSWALGIAAWECRTLHRQRERRRESPAAVPDQAAPQPTPEQATIERDLLGRARKALRLAPLVVAAAAIAIACGRPVALTCAIAAVLLPLCLGLAFAGGAAGRAVIPGLVAGGAAQVLPLLLITAGHAYLGPSCMELCLPACIVGGAIAGALIARTAVHERRDPAFIGAAVAVAALTGALGCTAAGAGGVVGMLVAAVAAGTPVLVAARR